MFRDITQRSGNSLTTFRDNLSGPIFKSQEIQESLELLIFEDGTARLPRNVGKELPLYTV